MLARIMKATVGLDQCLNLLQNDMNLLKDTSPKRFEEIVTNVFKQNGYLATHVGKAGDNGVDIIAIHENNISPINYLIQCKHLKNKIGVSTIRELYGVKTDLKASKAILVTTSDFTKGAMQFAEKNTWEIELIDFNNLSNIILGSKKSNQ
jgi:restriction endonuclease Mrr